MFVPRHKMPRPFVTRQAEKLPVEKCILWLVHLAHLQLEYTLFIYYVYFMQKQGPDPLS